MEQLYRASRVISDVIFSLGSLAPKNAIFGNFALLYIALQSGNFCHFWKSCNFPDILFHLSRLFFRFK